MLHIGLTGGIGSGKSTVVERLGHLGAVVVDADRIAREVVEAGTAGYEAVVAEFGRDVLAADGSIDRSALSRLVFGDEAHRHALNAIVHPLVAGRRRELLVRAPPDVVVVEDIPLLVENGMGAGFHLVLVVHAPAELRVQRLVASRGMEPDDVRARMLAQADDDARRQAADVWLDNSGSRGDVLAAVEAIWRDRLVPFEVNLRAGQRAPRATHAVLAPVDPSWAAQARRLTDRIRHVAGERAVRVDHHGSTAVAGLPAKDVLDIQVVTAGLEAATSLAVSLQDAGLVPMPGRWYDIDRGGMERDKAMACNADPGRAANVHIRSIDSPSWRDALLLRDWLRSTPAALEEYAAFKRRLAGQPHESIDDYAAAKTPWINEALTRADDWAARTGWSP